MHIIRPCDFLKHDFVEYAESFRRKISGNRYEQGVHRRFTIFVD